LFFLNLANDVIQTGKKKGDAFSPEFEKVLPGAFENTFQFERLIRFVNQDLKKQVKRIVAIWRERKIYSTEYLNKLEEKAGLGTSSPKKEKSVVIPELKAMLPLLELLRVIQKDQLDEVTRISAIRPVLYLPDEVPHINGKD
jgi:hypothetical protein